MMDFGSISPPTCFHKSTKIHHKSMSRCLTMLTSFFDRFLVDFGSNLDLKTTPNSIKKSFLKLFNSVTTKIVKMLFSYYVFTIFTYFGSLNMCCKTVKNVSYIQPEIASKTMFQFASVLEPNWLHFGRVLAPKLVPTSPQDTLKSHSQNHQKTDHILDRLWKDFWWILASKLGPFLVDF